MSGQPNKRSGRRAAQEVRLKQILAGQFTGRDGTLSYSVLGLGEDGKVYRYDPPCEGWLPWSMEVAECRDEHPGRR